MRAKEKVLRLGLEQILLHGGDLSKVIKSLENGTCLLTGNIYDPETGYG